MTGLELLFFVAAVVLAGSGLVGVVILEFTSSRQRRMVGAFRDAMEVLLPPVLTLILVWVVATA